MRTYLLMSCFVTAVHTRFIQSHHSGLTQQAHVACWTTVSENHMRFFLVKNSDRIDAVYTVANDNITDTSINRFDSFGKGVEGNGTVDDPFTFEITTSTSTFELDPDVQADTKAATEGDDIIRVNVMSKSLFVEPFYQSVIFAEDVLYNAVCNFSDVQGQVVVTTQSVDVEGSIRENPIIVNNKAVLEVLDANDTVTTRVRLGESVSLSVRPLETNVSGITGVYVKNCFVCNNVQCSGSAVTQFIGPEGCSIGNYITPFTSPGFGAATTEQFPMFQFNGEVTAYFKCDVGFCFDPASEICKDFCKASDALLGRRKRQAEPEEVVLYAVLTVEPGEEPQNTGGDAENLAAASVSNNSADMNLVAAVCSVAGVLCLMLVLAGVIYYRITQRRSRVDR